MDLTKYPDTHNPSTNAWNGCRIFLNAKARRSKDAIAKYNQLLRIEEDLGDTVGYPGREAFYQIK